MIVEPLAIPDVKLLKPRVFGDERGVFFETWNAERFGQHGLPTKFVQSNVSTSVKGVLRGRRTIKRRPSACSSAATRRPTVA